MIKRLFAAGALLAATALVAGCSAPGGDIGNGATMDRNMSAKADEMEATANSRANAMAGDMMSNATQPTVNDGMPANGADDN